MSIDLLTTIGIVTCVQVTFGQQFSTRLNYRFWFEWETEKINVTKMTRIVIENECGKYRIAVFFLCRLLLYDEKNAKLKTFHWRAWNDWFNNNHDSWQMCAIARVHNIIFLFLSLISILLTFIYVLFDWIII